MKVFSSMHFLWFTHKYICEVILKYQNSQKELPATLFFGGVQKTVIFIICNIHKNYTSVVLYFILSFMVSTLFYFKKCFFFCSLFSFSLAHSSSMFHVPEPSFLNLDTRIFCVFWVKKSDWKILFCVFWAKKKLTWKKIPFMRFLCVLFVLPLKELSKRHFNGNF